MRSFRMNDIKRSEFSEEFLKNVYCIRKDVKSILPGHRHYYIKINSTGFCIASLEYIFRNTRDEDYEALKKICDYNVSNILDVVPKDKKVSDIEYKEFNDIINEMKEILNEIKQNYSNNDVMEI